LKVKSAFRPEDLQKGEMGEASEHIICAPTQFYNDGIYTEGGEALTQVAQRWSMPHSWKCSRSGWTGLWATWSSWRCPCSWRGGGWA